MKKKELTKLINRYMKLKYTKPKLMFKGYIGQIITQKEWLENY